MASTDDDCLLQLKVANHRRQLPCTLRIHEAFFLAREAELRRAMETCEVVRPTERTGLARIR